MSGRPRRRRSPLRRAVGALGLLATLALLAAAAFVGVFVLAEQAERDQERGGRAGPTAPTAPGATAEPPRGPEATCPAGAANCRAHTGRVVYVESVDPDGDGDLHVVVTGGSVTAPGITVLDVGPALRPAQDPRVGDLVSGAGPVFKGSLGQSQIEVDTFRVVSPRSTR